MFVLAEEMAIYVAEIREKSMSEERIKVQQIKDTYEEQMRTLGVRTRANTHCNIPTCSNRFYFTPSYSSLVWSNLL